MHKLQSVHDALAEHIAKPRMGRRRPSGLTMVDSMHGSGGGGAASLWSSLMGGGGGSRAGGGRKAGVGSGEPVVYHEPLVKGLYMHGGVGCGKTVREG